MEGNTSPEQTAQDVMKGHMEDMKKTAQKENMDLLPWEAPKTKIRKTRYPPMNEDILNSWVKLLGWGENEEPLPTIPLHTISKKPLLQIGNGETATTANKRKRGFEKIAITLPDDSADILIRPFFDEMQWEETS